MRPDPTHPAVPAPDDPALLARCVRGDEKAWEWLLAGILPAIRAAARVTLVRYGRSGRPDVLEELVQDTLLRLVKDDCALLRQYDPARARMTTWAAVIARSVTVDWLRKPALLTDPLERAADVAVFPERALAAGDVADAAASSLSPAEQVTFRLLFGEGLSAAQAARLQDTTIQTIYSRKNQILRKLREFLR